MTNYSEYVMTVEITVWEPVKYEITKADKPRKVKYSIKGFRIITGEEARQIESETDEDGHDEYHEYLRLYPIDGGQATFRNSHVDMHEAR